MPRAVASIILVFTLGIMLTNPSAAGYSICCPASSPCNSASDCIPSSIACAAPCHLQTPTISEGRLGLGDLARSALAPAEDDCVRGASLEPALRPPI